MNFSLCHIVRLLCCLTLFVAISERHSFQSISTSRTLWTVSDDHHCSFHSTLTMPPSPCILNLPKHLSLHSSPSQTQPTQAQPPEQQFHSNSGVQLSSTIELHLYSKLTHSIHTLTRIHYAETLSPHFSHRGLRFQEAKVGHRCQRRPCLPNSGYHGTTVS
jgi:hypothetical protein